MKLPRGVPADRLIRALEQFGYRLVRQKGSHVRLKHEGPPVNLITVPAHDPLKTGTLHGILTEVARMRSVAMESIARLLQFPVPILPVSSRQIDTFSSNSLL